ncbi:hypothetical protein [Marivita sp.]|uniref:hypothetical protein n=1 Tax=Marivita sp. TaxID=2003365 RepID=UPI0032194659
MDAVVAYRRAGDGSSDDPNFDASFDLHLGDRVRWTVRPPGTGDRRGTIVAVVERGCEPGLVVPKGMKCPKGGYGRPRQWRTFLVKRRGGSVAYWPQTRSMRLDDARAKGN